MPAPARGCGLHTCLVLLCVVAGSRQLSITEFAVPSTVEAGNNAELQCRHSDAERVDYVKWWWTPLYAASEDQNRVLLYQRLTGHAAEIARKNVESKDNDTIVLMDLKSYDSGVYECEVSNVAEVRKHQELIVFSNGSGIELNVSKIEDGDDEDDIEEVFVLCEVHDATPLPKLSIFVEDNKIDNITQYVSGGDNGLYDVSTNVTLGSDSIDEWVAIRCELSYENPNVSQSYTSEITYTSGTGLSTTETPEDTTSSEVASELKNTNGVSHGSRWVLNAGFVVLAVLNNLL